MDDELIREILRTTRTIAVVGMSRDPVKAAHRVPMFLKQQGYHIIPINPHARTIAGLRVYPELTQPPEDIDVVEIFRPSHEVLPHVEAALQRHLTRGDIKVIWLQEGIRNEKARRLAERAHLIFIEDRCMQREYLRLMVGHHG